MADEIRGEGAIVVEVGFLIWNWDRIYDFSQMRRTSHLFLEFNQVALQQRKLRGIVTNGHRKRETIIRVVCENHAEVIGLHGLVTGARRGEGAGTDFGQQAMLIVKG